MGSSPGFANILVKFADDFLFDTIESIDILSCTWWRRA